MLELTESRLRKIVQEEIRAFSKPTAGRLKLREAMGPLQEFEWAPGMQTTGGHRVIEVEDSRIAVARPGRDYVEWLDSENFEPDRSDPCTAFLIQRQQQA